MSKRITVCGGFVTVDLTPYAGRWVAMIGDQVAGVGYTAEEAARLARHNRPKERFTVRFVEAPGGKMLALSSLLARLRPLFERETQPIYLVGGAVRDALLGRASPDLDFAVPEQAVRLTFRVADALGVPAYVLDRERDTGRVVLPEAGTTLDFARFRGPSLEADLRDRDFTVNAMALPATASRDASVIDPLGGRADLQARRLRLTHERAILDDPVRALRALRLALSLNFSLSPETIAAVKAAVPYLHTVSSERVRDELLKLLQTANPDQAVVKMAELGLLAAVLPEIAALAEVEQSAPHHEPVLPHTVSVLRWLARVEAALEPEANVDDPAVVTISEALADYAPALKAHLQRYEDGKVDGRTLLRLGALLHDVGKGETRTVEENGRVRFIGHEQVGARMAARRLRHLALSNKAVAHVRLVVANHMRPLLLAQTAAQPSRRAVYRFFRDAGSAGLDVSLLALADHLATHDGPGDPGQWQRLLAVITTLLGHYFERYEETIAPPPLLNGGELMVALNLEPGPEVGRLLRLVEEAQAAGEVTTKEEAIQFARQSRQ